MKEDTEDWDFSRVRNRPVSLGIYIDIALQVRVRARVPHRLPLRHHTEAGRGAETGEDQSQAAVWSRDHNARL